MMITDSHGRRFRKLRVSLTSQCNFSCLYCTGVHHESKPTPLQPVLADTGRTASERLIANINAIHQMVGLTSVRLTGGEPLLNPSVTTVVAAVKNMGIDDIRLTTNGFLLPQFAKALKDAGLKSVNVSLDAIDPEVFKAMTRRGGHGQVLKGIDKGLDEGLDVKLNAVIMRNRNESQILPLLRFANQRGIIVRYLELMQMGPLHQTAHLWMVPQHEILDTIKSQYAILPIPRKDGSTANYWQTFQGQVFGVIANESEPFCADCDRLRLDASGVVYGCIGADKGIALPVNPQAEQMALALQQAMNQKQTLKFSGSRSSMMAMGG